MLVTPEELLPLNPGSRNECLTIKPHDWRSVVSAPNSGLSVATLLASKGPEVGSVQRRERAITCRLLAMRSFRPTLHKALVRVHFGEDADQRKLAGGRDRAGIPF